MTTTDVDNWPADADGVQGPELMQRFQKHAERFETEIVFDHIHTVHLGAAPVRPRGRRRPPTPATRWSSPPAPSAKYLGLPSEQKFMGTRRVGAAPPATASSTRARTWCVVGGGNTAVEEALYLSNIAASVTLVHRRDKFRAEKIMVDKLMQAGAPTARSSCVLDARARRGAGRRQPASPACACASSSTASTEDLAVKGFFVAIGHTPNTEHLRGPARDGERLHRHARRARRASPPRPACRACSPPATCRTTSTARRSPAPARGCMAALDAEKYLDALAA